MVSIYISGAIFVITFIAILRERVDRTIVAMAGAAAMVVAGLGLGFYSQEAALESIDFNTLGLLLGMMVLVGMLSESGFFPVPGHLRCKEIQGKAVALAGYSGGYHRCFIHVLG